MCSGEEVHFINISNNQSRPPSSRDHKLENEPCLFWLCDKQIKRAPSPHCELIAVHAESAHQPPVNMHEMRLVPQMMMSPGCWRQAFRCTRRLLTARVTVISGTSSRCRLKMIKSLLLLLYCSSETTHTQNLQYSGLSALTSTNRSICLLLAE